MPKPLAMRLPEYIIKYLDKVAKQKETSRTAAMISIIEEYRVRQEVKAELRPQDESATKE